VDGVVGEVKEEGAVPVLVDELVGLGGEAVGQVFPFLAFLQARNAEGLVLVGVEVTGR